MYKSIDDSSSLPTKNNERPSYCSPPNPLHPEFESSEVLSLSPIGLHNTHCVNIERLGKYDFLSCQLLL